MIPKFPGYVFINDVGIVRGKQNNVIRSEMEIGPQKTRPRQSIPMFNISMDVSICVDKERDFESWYQTQLKNGALWFTMKDPINGVKRRFRFVEYEWGWSKAGNLLTSNFVLEAYDEL